MLAPLGRDALVATSMLKEAGLSAEACLNLGMLLREIERGVGAAIVTEEALGRADIKGLAAWIARQPPWSDLPFVLLIQRGGGLERNPAASRLMEVLGNVSFLERPFHPTTLISVVRTALRGRRRQYEARARLEALRKSEAHARLAEAKLRRLNETLETRVEERTDELAAANRQLVAQIEERERVEATLRQMQRLEAVGQLTSGVAHDFNNLLTVVLGNLTFLEKEFSGNHVDTKLAKRLSYVRTAAERGAMLTAQLLAFSRRQRLASKPIDLNEAIANMRDLLQSTLGGSVHINTILRSGLWPALVDPTQIELVVLNLAINAREGTSVKVYLRRATGAESTEVHGGVTAAPPSLQTSGAIVLVVDDDSAVREVTASMLRERGYVVLEVGSGGAALELLDRRSDIDLALIDLAMPGMNGAEVARQAHSKRPALPIVFVTGYVDMTALSEIGDEQIVKKPFVGDELANKVRAALGTAPGSFGKVVPLRR